MKHDLDYYRKIQGISGVTSYKEAEVRMIKSELAHDFHNSIDCECVAVNGASTTLLITKTADYAIKKVVTKPDESVHLGDIITWCDTDWIIDTIDADDRINTHAKMRRCNVVLRWLDENGATHAYSGFCEDATKYGEGVTSGKTMQVPDFQMKVKIHLDQQSAKINRDMRFLLDASQYLSLTERLGAHPSAFIVTRRNVLTGNYAGSGYAELTMKECAFSAQDNPTLMIADYYKPSDVYEVVVHNVVDNVAIKVGEELTLDISAMKNGSIVGSEKVSIASSQPSVAIVGQGSIITGISQGDTTITVKYENAQRIIPLTVMPAHSDSRIEIIGNSDDVKIPFGQQKIIEYEVLVDGQAADEPVSVSVTPKIAGISLTALGNRSFSLSIPNDESMIGTCFAVELKCDDLSLTASKEVVIVGWF